MPFFAILWFIHFNINKVECIAEEVKMGKVWHLLLRRLLSAGEIKHVHVLYLAYEKVNIVSRVQKITSVWGCRKDFME